MKLPNWCQWLLFTLAVKILGCSFNRCDVETNDKDEVTRLTFWREEDNDPR